MRTHIRGREKEGEIGKGSTRRVLERTATATTNHSKFDTISVQMKNWYNDAIALTGISFLKDEPKFLFLNIVLVLVSYLAEVEYRLAHDAFLARTRNVEAILRGAGSDRRPYASTH